MEVNQEFTHVTNRIRSQYQASQRQKLLIVCLTCAVTILLSILSLLLGSTSMNPFQALAGCVGLSDSYTNAVMQNIRLPHVLCAIVAGAGLALAGCTFQGVLYNPLASPSTIGVSQGAAFGASIALIVLNGAESGSWAAINFSSPALVALCAFLGACVSAVIILALSKLSDLTPESIVLAGVALSALFSGATAMVQYFADDTQVAAVVFWTFGSLRKAGYAELVIMTLVTVGCGLFFFVNRWNINAIASGQSQAHNLGVNVQTVRLACVLVGTVCASTAIAFCGTINFIGLVAPHIMRRFIGSDYRYLIPGSAAAGAALLLISDIIAANLLPSTILPISAITSFIGAPFFIYLLLKGGHR